MQTQRETPPHGRPVVLLVALLGAWSGRAAGIGRVSYRVVDTGQDQCYDDRGRIECPQPGRPYFGQDAQYRGPQMSFRDNRDGTVTDFNTGLMWQKSPAPGTLTWDRAMDYAQNLTLAGHSDWRLPTIKELYSIVDFSGNQHRRIPYLDTKTFDFEWPDVSTGVRAMDAQYWSSNRYVGTTMGGDISAFGFNFADGRIKAYPINLRGTGRGRSSFVRCVRAGGAYGKNDFVDNGDGTITDRATGLMWTQGDSGKTLNWKEALAYAEGLEHAGYDDWRLPNAKELQSIVDYTRAPDATDANARGPAIDPIFELTDPESWYWTSTTHGDNNGHAIYISFGRSMAYDRRAGRFTVNAHGAGAQRSDPKSGDPARRPRGLGPQADQIRIQNYARCVRGGNVQPTTQTTR